ncbi:geranylgeranylglycerol-phosphate geranylgeranyltransferase [Winogradskyella maritima]|uniref:Geranylgeranylglycerol-phosphate geranylgeranyltransferase n=1 Tax=Winogradskyella maritima TaxID=1517766 RepID=A0ABV8AC82_9FLAO|nr:geranylgeranylglycerol-phosphate geranylgeranyltransferase [Winogradskyella maritima]
MAFLNLIRWKNLLLIALAQVLIKYALLEPFEASYGVETALEPIGLAVLILATLCIAGAGYIINDIQDVEADLINKPEKVIVGKSISEKTASNLFIILNVIGVGLGYYISFSINQTGFFALFVIISGLLYLYSTYLKSILLAGNVVVSLLVAFSLIIVGLYDLLPMITDTNREVQLFFFILIRDYAVFAFMINLLRELVKDIEDVNGDHKVGVQSLPIVVGRERATKVVFILSLIPLLVIVFYVINNLYKQTEAVVYFLIAVIAPLIYVSLKLFSAEKKSDYKHISTILKIVMLTGILSLLLYQFII